MKKPIRNSKGLGIGKSTQVPQGAQVLKWIRGPHGQQIWFIIVKNCSSPTLLLNEYLK